MGSMFRDRVVKWRDFGGMPVVVHANSQRRSALSNVEGGAEIAGEAVDYVCGSAGGCRAGFV